jgi:hypothetical protein
MRERGMAARWPLHATTAVVPAMAGSATLLLRNFRSECPQRAEMMANRGLRNGAIIAAVEAVAVERGDDPHGSRFDFVGAIWPRVKGTLQVVAESSRAVGKELFIDSNSICTHLDVVSGKCDGGFEKRRSAIGANPRRAILTAEGDGCRCPLRTELHKMGAGRMAGDVKAAREGWSEIEADPENPARNESEEERRRQQAGPQNGAANSLAQFI